MWPYDRNVCHATHWQRLQPGVHGISRDALKIAVATARNVQIDDNAVVHFNFYKTAACADRCIFNFHN